MDKQDKISILRNFPRNVHAERYFDLLNGMEDLKYNYWEYMTTEPINCDVELERIPAANYELCAALLTMLLREDHFSNGSFGERIASGAVDAIIDRMIENLL